MPSKFLSNPKLATWVDTQRTLYRQLQESGKASELTEERISSLEEIGFVWNVHDYKWNQHYEELEMFKEINGHFRIPGTKATRQLHRWTYRQVSEYKKYQKGEKSSLTQDRVDKLRKIGLVQ